MSIINIKDVNQLMTDLENVIKDINYNYDDEDKQIQKIEQQIKTLEDFAYGVNFIQYLSSIM